MRKQKHPKRMELVRIKNARAILDTLKEPFAEDDYMKYDDFDMFITMLFHMHNEMHNYSLKWQASLAGTMVSNYLFIRTEDGWVAKKREGITTSDTIREIRDVHKSLKNCTQIFVEVKQSPDDCFFRLFEIIPWI